MATAAAVRLFSTSKQRPGQLSDHAASASSAVAALLLPAKKLVHCEASKSTGAVACRTIYASCSVASI